MRVSAFSLSPPLSLSLSLPSKILTGRAKTKFLQASQFEGRTCKVSSLALARSVHGVGRVKRGLHPTLEQAKASLDISGHSPSILSIRLGRAFLLLFHFLIFFWTNLYSTKGKIFLNWGLDFLPVNPTLTQLLIEPNLKAQSYTLKQGRPKQPMNTP